MSFADREPNFDDRDREDVEKGISRVPPKGTPFSGNLDELFAMTEKAQIEWQAQQLTNGAELETTEITDPEESARLDRQLRDSLRIYGHTELLDTHGNEISDLMLPFDAPWIQATPEEIEEASQDPYSYIRVGWRLKLGGDVEDSTRVAEGVINGSLARGIAEQSQRMSELDLPED